MNHLLIFIYCVAFIAGAEASSDKVFDLKDLRKEAIQALNETGLSYDSNSGKFWYQELMFHDARNERIFHNGSYLVFLVDGALDKYTGEFRLAYIFSLKKDAKNEVGFVALSNDNKNKIDALSKAPGMLVLFNKKFSVSNKKDDFIRITEAVGVEGKFLEIGWSTKDNPIKIAKLLAAISELDYIHSAEFFPNRYVRGTTQGATMLGTGKSSKKIDIYEISPLRKEILKDFEIKNDITNPSSQCSKLF